MHTIILKSGREKALLRRHPWIFSGAIAKVEGDPGIGETVAVLDSSGEFLARGAFSPESQIRVRVWTFDPDESVDDDFFRLRLKSALDKRKLSVFRDQSLSTDNRQLITCRLIHAESDGLPGLVVDSYVNTLVMQVLSAGVEHWREIIADLLLELTGADRIFERSDVDVRKLEGLPLRIGTVRGELEPERIQIEENGLKFWVDVSKGHKTGFYLDQRNNRARVQEMAAGRDILDCFSYSGGFALSALLGGAASATAVDSSSDALALAEENRILNDLPAEKIEWLEGDVFQVLRKFRDSRRDFDMIILDPPKFAPTSSQAQKAARGYKDINLLAFKLLRPGGILVTFSCSGGISAELFQKIVAGAALDAGVDAQIIEHLEQSPDHPVALNFPEGAYLKGLVIRVG
ncbi:MAG: class I SAM-dependent methyltransferase [Anaerolineales bacterium]|nr:class I SAM-dependent methyltransferase [Chloroflexota bacterium]MBL6980868.1 class I SAM-dependent methyltransferase [Anaerolineales bacterium]